MNVELLITGAAVLIGGGLLSKVIFSGKRKAPEEAYRSPFPANRERAYSRKSRHSGERGAKRPAVRDKSVSDHHSNRYKDGPNTTDDGDFAVSAAVAAATDSTLLGYAVGGSLAGAFVGDMLNDESYSQDSHEEISGSSDDSYSDAGGDSD